MKTVPFFCRAAPAVALLGWVMGLTMTATREFSFRWFIGVAALAVPGVFLKGHRLWQAGSLVLTAASLVYAFHATGPGN